MWTARATRIAPLAVAALAASLMLLVASRVVKQTKLQAAVSMRSTAAVGAPFARFSSSVRVPTNTPHIARNPASPFGALSRASPRRNGLQRVHSTATATNPLIAMQEGVFPPYDTIQAETVVPGMRQIIEETSTKLSKLEKSINPTWTDLVEPLEKLSDPLERTWGAVQHLKMVRDSEDLRKAVEEIQPEVVTLSLQMGQSKPIAKAFEAMKDNEEFYKALSPAQQRIVDSQITQAKLSGVSLEGEAQEEFNKIQQRLSELSMKFGNNVLDATKAFSVRLTDKKDVSGLPSSALGLAAQTARDKGDKDATAENGPWVLTLDIPSYMAVMTYADDRALRQKMYTAQTTRASKLFPEGKENEEFASSDNSEIVLEILRLRQKKADLLGFKNHAEVSMATKMASYDKALELLEDLRKASFEAAKKEHEDLQAFAEKDGADFKLQRWDTAYYAEKMRKEMFDLDEEALRPYFALPTVLDGLFRLIDRLFDVKVVKAPFQPPTWAPDVLFYQVVDKEDKPVAYFYLDPYTRPAEKRGGAWMNTVVGRSELLAPNGETVRLPVAHMVLNQSPPVDGAPSLMKFREVETLFHEMGHALQHMLTTQSEGMVAGINGVEWDAVEQPSQFMENWLYDEPTLMGMAEHYDTKEKLPTEEFQKIKNARTFRAGSAMVRQLHFATTDLLLHSVFDEAKQTPYGLDREVAAKTEALAPEEFDRFLNGFSHIFAGGYSAGYYSYKWAEVLSADCFAAFEEVGLENEQEIQETGRRFRDTVLALGGGLEPMEVFNQFRGREPSVEPLLRHAGLIPAM